MALQPNIYFKGLCRPIHADKKKLLSTTFGLSVFQLVKSFYNMCLYPKLLLNRKYTPNKKNGFNPPQLTDERLKYVAVGCGNCIECRRQKARDWQVRLNEEIKIHQYKYFVTLTFSEENINKLTQELQRSESNAVAGIAIRRFLERWRKKYKKSVCHWLITELGHTNTERIHIHGVIMPNFELTNEELYNIWQYGITDIGQYCNARTINYIIKYVTKIDNDHKGYIPQIFCSSGIGKNYLNKEIARKNIFKDKDTKEYYTLNNGTKVRLPIYYRNKLYNDEQKEKLWINTIERYTTYVNGIEIRHMNTEQGISNYLQVLEQQQKDNIELGYGDASKNWKKKEYNATLKSINYKNTKKKAKT